jgi:hypothetical protein
MSLFLVAESVQDTFSAEAENTHLYPGLAEEPLWDFHAKNYTTYFSRLKQSKLNLY